MTLGRKLTYLLVAAFFSSMTAKAQLYTVGENPWGVKWYKIETPGYKIIYPEGLDSLALEYGATLERSRIPVGRSIGYLPNQEYRTRMPVVLEGFRADANGSVIWTPRRMSLYTADDATDSDPVPWMNHLIIHESRHASQMQFGRGGHFRLLSCLSGEMAAGGLAGLYGGSLLFEGDAVVTETALSHFGRGRSADFLEGFRVSLDHGDWRNLDQWSFGSLKKYTPDVYKAGYVTLAGIRCLYDKPLFMKSYYESLLGHKWWWFPYHNIRSHIKRETGEKPDMVFRKIEEEFQSIWEDNKHSRGPFGDVSTLTEKGRWHSEYRGLTTAGENIFAIKSSYADSPKMIRLTPEGHESAVCSFSSQTSSLQYSDSLGRIYWSEIVGDPRWGMRSSSRIRYLDPVSGRKISITEKGRLYNPSPYGKLLSITEYPFEGGSAVCVIDGDSGTVLRRYEAPDSVQVSETAALGEALYASAVTPAGFGIFRVDEGFSCVLPPRAVKLSELRSRGGRLLFTCDLNGARELYEFDVRMAEEGWKGLRQITNTVYGISGYAFPEGQEGVFFSSLDSDGRMIRRGALVSREPAELWEHPIAAKLSRQEADLAKEDPEEEVPVQISEPRRYGKLMNAIKIHSWLPAYVDYDMVSDFSLDKVYSSVKPGATVFLHNELESLYGTAGVAFEREAGTFRPSGHMNLTFRGWYPVIETSLNLNGRNAVSYRYFTFQTPVKKGYRIERHTDERTAVNGRVKVYVPLSFYSGGWYRGVTPQLSFNFSNDVFLTAEIKENGYRSLDSEEGLRYIRCVSDGDVRCMNHLTASLRAFAVQGTAKAGVYPRIGAGAEIGAGGRTGLGSFYSRGLYGYLYGYIPGILPNHGIRISAIAQRLDGEALVNNGLVAFLPRGLDSSEISSLITRYSDRQERFTFDYKATAFPVDLSLLWSSFYIRNFELGAHFDYTAFGETGRRNGQWVWGSTLNRNGNNRGGQGGGLYSAGFSISARFTRFLLSSFDCTIGVECSYNGGPAFSTLQQNKLIKNHFHAGLVFKTSIN